jgi:hypothetical protein
MLFCGSSPPKVASALAKVAYTFLRTVSAEGRFGDRRRRGRDFYSFETDFIFNILRGINLLLTEIRSTYFVQINCKSYEIKVLFYAG